MKNHNWLVLLASLMAGSSVNAQETEPSTYRTIVWRERPVAISMVPGKEKILSFSEDVKWGIPKSLVGIVTGEAVAGQVFLNTKSDFKQQRFRFYGIDSNRYYLLDITASDRGEETPLQIIYQETQSAVTNDNTADEAADPATTLVDLTRFAFQSIYAPQRLIQPLRDVSEVRIKDKGVKHHILAGADVDVTPVAQWRTDDGLFAVGLHIQNRESRKIELDPRQIRYGERWRTMALRSSYLNPANVVGDSTTAVIITDGAWEDVSIWLH